MSFSTKLSSKGQVIIPARIRQAHRWELGQELEVIDMKDGVLLRPKSPFEPASLDDLAGCLPYTEAPKSLEAMEEAIRKGAMEKAADDRG
ncbi:MAG: AbrB/MazE/SpoVT family DNA-binding domain-containing protein [Halothiobacillaceae bacterium]|jgi:AbrB family looped-hinge helix DNA binding protein|nr:AbrB/MazE/SpoVT family DNA-binding domain-containing protein [Halothiobacillaceae bacterium]